MTQNIIQLSKSSQIQWHDLLRRATPDSMRFYWNDQTLVNVKLSFYLQMLDELLADTSLHTAMIDSAMLNYAVSLSHDALDRRYKDIFDVSERLLRAYVVRSKRSVPSPCVVSPRHTQTQCRNWQQVDLNRLEQQNNTEIRCKHLRCETAAT